MRETTHDQSSHRSAASTGGGIRIDRARGRDPQAVAGEPDGITLAEVSAALARYSSTAFHLIRTLTSLGIVEQLESSATASAAGCSRAGGLGDDRKPRC
ncbi:MAG: helix-turn-helix domain-containing protein [Brucellaceae bacterium]|nr:helix-turn-helix domain-containing protein [Brucellaceae bacterium]